jgi:hypothetical protein
MVPPSLPPEIAEPLKRLGADRPADIESAVRELGRQLGEVPESDLRRVVEGICSLFYVDTKDRPELEPALEIALEVLAECGERVVPHLLEFMRGSDLKSHFYLARTLGRIGAPALPRLRRFIATEEDPYSRAFALYALGKMRNAAVHVALPEVVGSLMHPDREVRDSAARTLGKIAEVVPPHLLSERRRAEIFEALLRSSGDHEPAVRAKSIRSLGKLVRAGYLTPEQLGEVERVARSVLGENGWNWDHAYIVRREAEEALRAIGKPASS